MILKKSVKKKVFNFLIFFLFHKLTYHKILPITLSTVSASLSSTFYSILLFLKTLLNKLPKNEPTLLRARLYHGIFYCYY